jgi:accessory gene regulator B
MEILARKLANEIARTMQYDDEKEQVVAYGLIAIIQTAVTTVIVLLLGFLIGAPAEAMILCFSVSLLRRYTGGAHAETIELCTAISVIYCTVFSYVSRFVIGPAIGWCLLGAVSAGIYLAAFAVVYRRVPVDSPNKPIRTENKRKRMRKGSYLTLSVFFIVSVAVLLFGLKNNKVLSLQVSLLFGIAWQVFTLTKTGAGLIGRINDVYGKLFSGKKGGVST